MSGKIRVKQEANIVNEYEKSKTYEVVGPVTQQFVVNGAKDK